MSNQPSALNCEETMARLFPYLDRELAPDEAAAVRAHLDECGNCARLFRFEASVLTFLGDRLTRSSAPPALRERLRRMVQTARAGGG